MKFTRENASEMGRRGGRSRRTLSVDRAERDLGPLETLDDAQRRLDRVMIWSTGGLIPGAVAGSCVRAVEVWVKAEEARNSFAAVEALRERVRGLVAERDQLSAECDLLRAKLEQRGVR